MSKPTHLDLLAYHLYQTDNAGGFMVRWWCMDEEIKSKYTAEATQIYEKWSTDEMQREAEAENIDAMEQAR